MIKIYEEEKDLHILPNTELEKKYLFKDYGSRISDPGDARFADANSSFVYRFRLIPGTEAILKIDIDNQYIISISHDGSDYETLKSSGHKGDAGDNREELTFDLTDFIESPGYVYIKIEDEIKNNGWGGRVYSIKLNGTFDATPEEEKMDMEKKIKRRKLDNPLVIFEKKFKPLDSLYVVQREPLNNSERVMIASLQGLTTDESRKIFFDHPGYHRWLDELEKKNIKLIQIENPWELLNIYKNNIKGYILCKKDDYNAATSVA